MDGNVDNAGAEESRTRFIPLPRFDLGRLWWRSAARPGMQQAPGAVEALRDALGREEILLRRAASRGD